MHFYTRKNFIYLLILLSTINLNSCAYLKEINFIDESYRQLCDPALKNENIIATLQSINKTCLKHNLNVILVFHLLNAKIGREIKNHKECCSYFEKKINQKIDYTTLKYSIGLLLITCAGLKLTHFMYQKWHKPLSTELQTILQEFNKLGIYIFDTQYDSTIKKLSFSPGFSDKEISLHVKYVELMNNLNFIKKIEFLPIVLTGIAALATAAGTLYCLMLSPNDLFNYHKKNYENFCLIRETINKFAIVDLNGQSHILENENINEK